MKPQHPRERGSARALAGLLCAALALAAAGCGPSDPLDERVVAGNVLALTMWRADAQRKMTARQIADFERAVQEMRFHVMSTGAASGGDAVEDATLQMIDRQTVRHVLQVGLGWELERAETERATLEAGMKTNSLMWTRPGDSDAAHYLTDLRESQLSRLKAATDEVNRTRESLAATGMTVPAAPSPAPDR